MADPAPTYPTPETYRPGIDSDPDGASLAEAEWVCRRLRRLRASAAEVDTAAALIVAEAVAWRDAARAEFDPGIELAEGWLAAWMRARLELDPKGPKTTTLPSGTIRSAGQPLHVEVDDEAAFVAWARASKPTLLRTPEPKPPVPAPDKTRIKAELGLTFDTVDRLDPIGGSESDLVVRLTGEAVPGIRVVQPAPKVTITPRDDSYQLGR